MSKFLMHDNKKNCQTSLLYSILLAHSCIVGIHVLFLSSVGVAFREVNAFTTVSDLCYWECILNQCYVMLEIAIIALHRQWETLIIVCIVLIECQPTR